MDRDDIVSIAAIAISILSILINLLGSEYFQQFLLGLKG